MSERVSVLIWMKPRVSIIIPTRNRSLILARCLASLPSGACGLEKPELIVVDDCSTDETRKVIDDFSHTSGWPVQVLRQDSPLGANAARNAGLQIARGEIIVFIDDDALVTTGWLSKLIAGLSDKIPVVSGPVRLLAEVPVPGKHRCELSSYLSDVAVPARGAAGEIVPVACNMAALRWVFDRARFDEYVRPPVEENDWLRRAGVRAEFVQDALVWHYKTEEELRVSAILRKAWRDGGEAGWWARERLRLPARDRRIFATNSLLTSFRSFGHAMIRRCYGGVVIGIGELSRALAIVGVLNRRSRVPQSWR
jgi:glycosyltransferase involved in cell wall biosynthesis